MASDPRVRAAAVALENIIGMIDNCADVPRAPDSLPMMVLAEARQARAALAAADGVGWRPIAEAAPYKATREPILVRFYPDLVERTGRDDLDRLAGCFVVVRHSGFYERRDGTQGDLDWSVAAPVGYGGLPDEWIECWRPIVPPQEPSDG